MVSQWSWKRDLDSRSSVKASSSLPWPSKPIQTRQPVSPGSAEHASGCLEVALAGPLGPARHGRSMTAISLIRVSPLPDSNRRPPPYHGTSQATGRNQRQRFWLASAVLGRAAFATDYHWLHPRGSINVPSLVVNPGYIRRAQDAEPPLVLRQMLP
jgi:hypothetical protein